MYTLCCCCRWYVYTPWDILYISQYLYICRFYVYIFVYTKISRTRLQTRFFAVWCRLVRVASVRSTGCSSEKFSRFSPKKPNSCSCYPFQCSCGIVILKINPAATLLPTCCDLLLLSLPLLRSLSFSVSLPFSRLPMNPLSFVARSTHVLLHGERGRVKGERRNLERGACHSIVMCEARSCWDHTRVCI